MQSNMKAAPTPLFNYRKRQCQAILSDPQQLSTNTPASDCPQVTLGGQDVGAGRNLPVKNSVMNKENIATQFSSFSHSGNVTMATSAAGTAHRPSFGSVRQNNPGLMNINGQLLPSGTSTHTQQWSSSKLARQQAIGTQSMQYKQARYQQENASNSPRIASAVIRPQSNITSSSSSSSSSMMRTSTQPPTAGKASTFTSGCSYTAQVNTAGRSTPVCQNQVPKYVSDNTVRDSTCHNTVRDSTCHSTVRGSTCHSTVRDTTCHSTVRGSTCHSTAPSAGKVVVASHQLRTGPTRQSHNNYSGIQWNSARPTQHKSDFTCEEVDNVDFLSEHEFVDQTSRNSSQKNRIKQSHQPVDSPAGPDMSMRIFTCTIAMLKSWTAQRDRVGLVMCEIFGVIDSAVVRDHTGTGREFLLRDDTSTVTCVFYEIDREIPRLIRGQVCRVMASVLDKQNRLHIVSVRAALVEERLVCQAATQLSQVEMDKLASQ